MRALRIISIILLFAFFASLLIHSLNSINQDIGRHIKSGQIIWETKQVYKINLFSFTEPNNPFINHHWLSEVVFYGLANVIGLKGVILFKTAIILLALGLLLSSVYSKTDLWPLALSSIIGFLVFIERTDVRPEIFSYVFLAFFLFAIFRAKYAQTLDVANKKWLYALPFIQIFWTNMHIYFALGPILLLFFLIDRFFEKRESFKDTALVFIATSAATLLNPNFIKGALVPFNILRHYGYSIVENQNIFFLRDYEISLQSINIFQVSLIILLISFIIAFHNGRKKITFELLTASFMSILGVEMLRNFGIYALTFIPIVALNLSTLTFITTRRVVSPQMSRISKIGLIAFSALMVFLIFNVVSNNVYGWLESPNRFGLSLPNGAEKGVDFIKQNRVEGPVFNNFDVGSFLIWKLYPEQKVFVDGRPEAYTVDFFEKVYKPMQESPELWKKYSEKYKINYIFFDYKDITPWAQKFLSTISRNPLWPIVYLDESTVIFLKRMPENQRLIDKFEIKTTR